MCFLEMTFHNPRQIAAIRIVRLIKIRVARKGLSFFGGENQFTADFIYLQ